MDAGQDAGEYGRHYGKKVGERLRRARRNRLLSLAGAEEASGGRWDRAVLGSYERGSRAMKVETLAELAAFFNIPVRFLLPPEEPVDQRQEGSHGREALQ